MRAARLRVVTVTAAAVFLAVLCWHLSWRGDVFASAVCVILVGLLVDARMYLRDIEGGRRHTPASQHLADALAAVRPDAEAAVAKASELAAGYLDRALKAEATIVHVHQLRDQAPAHAQGPTWVGLATALTPPDAEQPCTCTFSQRCAQCPPLDDSEPDTNDVVHSNEEQQVRDSPGVDEPGQDWEGLIHRRQPAYDAVFAYIRQLEQRMPADTAHRDATVWGGVTAALDALDIGRCVSSHCVENQHMVLVPEPARRCCGRPAGGICVHDISGPPNNTEQRRTTP